jgi:hypothetical protein
MNANAEYGFKIDFFSCTIKSSTHTTASSQSASDNTDTSTADSSDSSFSTNDGGCDEMLRRWQEGAAEEDYWTHLRVSTS